MGNNESNCHKKTNIKTNTTRARFTSNSDKIRKLLNYPCHNNLHTMTESSTFTPTVSTAGNTPASQPPQPSISPPETPFPSLKVTRVTQRVIHDRLSEIAADFWRDNIESLNLKDRLEIACSIWFGMTASNMEIHRLLISRFTTNNAFEMAAFRNLDMIGFVIRSLYASHTNLSSLLYKLGILHHKLGIKSEYYHIMWQQVNQTLKYYYPQKYTIQIEFAICEVFSYTVQAMSGYDIKITTPCNDISFLQSLRCCIGHKIGREYLFRFLINVYCDEVVIFFHLLSVYKSTKNLSKRYKIAKNIYETCVAPDGIFCVNISYDIRKRMLFEMSVLDKENVGIDFFLEVEDELCRLIMQTHWKRFKTQINELYLIE